MLLRFYTLIKINAVVYVENTMMKILYVNPIFHNLFDMHFEMILRSVAAPGTKVDVVSFPPRENTPPFAPSSPFFVRDAMIWLKKAEEEGYDAAIIGCVKDPGLLQARKKIGIPLVAPLWAQAHEASLICNKFSVITENASHQYWFHDLLKAYNLASRLASCRSADIKRPSYENQMALNRPQHLKKKLLYLFRKAMKEEVPKQAKKAVKQDGAGAIILGCTFFSGWDEERNAIISDLKVQVLDPVYASLRMAEKLISQ